MSSLSDANAGAAGANVIEARDLVVTYGEQVALKGVSLVAGQGQVLGLLGPNGAGKSTFVRACLGLIRPASGTMRVLGLDPVTQGERVRRQVGFILEHPGLYEALSCRANLEFYGRIYGLGPVRLAARIDELLEKFDLGGRARDPAGALSKGLKQRLVLARALLHEPRLILLDEPTSALDPAAAREVRQVVAGVVRERSCTVLLTTHNMVEAERLCDAVAIIRRGEVVRRLDSRQLAGMAGLRVRCRGVGAARAEEIARLAAATDFTQQEDVTEFIFDPALEADAVRQAVAEAGGQVLEVVRSGEGLEAAYLSLTGGGGK
jgi:ABC-2 type transport system ATP-binding protein